MNPREQILHDILGKTVHIEVDRPIGYQHGTIIYPINYGYIPGMIGGDGEELDAYILGVTEPISCFDGQVVGAIARKDDCEDKLIVAPTHTVFHQAQIESAVRFQEQYFDHYVISLFRKSCGVLPYRIVGNDREYLIIFEQFSKCWSLPKGHMEPEETEIDTALRELQEETGLLAQLDQKAPVSIQYPIPPIVKKELVIFSGKVTGNPRVRQGEIESFRWVKKEDLKNYLHPDTINACKTLLED